MLIISTLEGRLSEAKSETRKNESSKINENLTKNLTKNRLNMLVTNCQQSRLIALYGAQQKTYKNKCTTN